MERRTSSRTTARAFWSAAAALLIAAGVCTATASAHTAPITASCEAGLSVVLIDYNANGVNTLRVWIDGTPRATTTFGSSSSATFAFGDLTVSHTWRVSVTAWDDPSGAKGWTFDTGTRTIPVCAKPTTTAATTTTAASVVVTVPGTIAPATTVASATTVAPATTAAPATTVAPPTTATVASAVVTAPAGSGDAPASTSMVAQAAPTSIVASSGTLPATGPVDVRALGIALLLFGFGILLIVATRRPDAA